MTTTPYKITAATGLHKGDRDYQQDQLALWPHIQTKKCSLGVVADGMGGRSGGRKASDQVLLTAKQLFDRFAPETDSPADLLKRIVHEAHTVIKLTAMSAEEEPHSTIAAFLMCPDGSCHWVHVGDSRIYHFHDAQMVRRTIDHSYVQSLVDQGTLSEEAAKHHPQSNVLMSCLGTETEPPATLHHIAQLQAGDAIMACSDGVWHYVSDSEIGASLQQHSAKQACETLIEMARQRAHGRGDNLSMVVVKVDALEG
jgi:serine/threonine protein phosphatase PrpC